MRGPRVEEPGEPATGFNPVDPRIHVFAPEKVVACPRAGLGRTRGMAGSSLVKPGHDERVAFPVCQEML